MDRAVDTQSRSIVYAVQARQGRLYRCEHCGKPVQLIPSGYMMQHFRHEKGVATQASCDLYITGRGSYFEQLIAEQREIDSVSPFAVSLGLLIYKGRDVWSLQVAIRSETYFAARVLIELGGRQNHIDIEGKGKTGTLLADPSYLPYRILSVNGETVQERIEHSTPGLSKNLATVFGPFGKMGERAVHRAIKLVGGKSYALIWPINLTVAIPPEILSFELDERYEHSGAVISIPEYVSDELENWLARLTGLQYEPGPQSISLLWPPPVDFLTSSHLAFCDGKSVLLQVNGGQEGELLSVTYGPNNDQIYSASTEDDGVYFADLSAVDSAIFTSSDDKAVVFLELTTLQADVGLQAVMEFELDKTTTLSLSVFDSQAEHWINEVRHGHAYLKSIFLPPGATVTVFLRSKGLWDEALNFSGNGDAMPIIPTPVAEVDIENLSNLIKNSSAELLVDFGVFGRLICAEAYTLKSTSSEVKLSHDLRKSIQFYLLQHPGRKSRTQNLMRPSDQALIEEFWHCGVIPETLAIRNSIANALTLKSGCSND